MLHTQPCGARQPLRPPSRRCQSLAADQLPRGEVGGPIQLTRQKASRRQGATVSPFQSSKTLPSLIRIPEQPADRSHLPGRDHPNPSLRAVCPPPSTPETRRSHLVPLQSPGSPRGTASPTNWEATGFGSKGHFEVKQKVAWGASPDPGPALDCPQAL